MRNRDFIFSPGTWIGEGKITFSHSHEFIKFYTKWQITQEGPHHLKAIQAVEIQGVEDHVVNVFTFSNITPTTFSVELENNIVGVVSGTGLADDLTIAWEFKGSATAFEGFEVYERQDNGDYSLHAEYTSSDQFRTTIEGLIWKKSD